VRSRASTRGRDSDRTRRVRDSPHGAGDAPVAAVRTPRCRPLLGVDRNGEDDAPERPRLKTTSRFEYIAVISAGKVLDSNSDIELLGDFIERFPSFSLPSSVSNPLQDTGRVSITGSAHGPPT